MAPAGAPDRLASATALGAPRRLSQLEVENDPRREFVPSPAPAGRSALRAAWAVAQRGAGDGRQPEHQSRLRPISWFELDAPWVTQDIVGVNYEAFKSAFRAALRESELPTIGHAGHEKIDLAGMDREYTVYLAPVARGITAPLYVSASISPS